MPASYFARRIDAQSYSMCSLSPEPLLIAPTHEFSQSLGSRHLAIAQYQRKASKFIQHIEEVGGRVLVHCVAGCSRSVCLVLMHLMVHHGVYLRDGWEHMKSVRPHINPNEGFKLALAKLEVEIFGATTMANCNDKLWDFYGWNAVKGSYPKRLSRKEQQSSCAIL
mmetsp:Transcript_29387/g.50723  ORF Transcript_29387/g.50723 Transcript_29387/m.50723 type:complete len:166 (+) Transcript_29387:41-538(+)